MAAVKISRPSSFCAASTSEVFGKFPHATTAAEESTAWPQVSRPTEFGGLGFGYKWNMGWMHDTLNYISKDPIYRKHHHGQILFGLHYAFSENFILPLSHDEVVHGKRSILGRMPGDEWQRFANLRAYYAFMFGHPGKKLMFMGAEFGQEREWNHDHSLDWHLLDQERHQGVQAVIRDLNTLYRDVPALHELDCDPAGFEWVIANDADRSIFAWMRKGESGRARCLMIANFTPSVHRDFRVRVPFAGKWREALNTDSAHYGGSNVGNNGLVETLEGSGSRTQPDAAAARGDFSRTGIFIMRLSEGTNVRLGANWDGRGTNFALFSANAEKVELCLFDSQGRREIERVALPEHTEGVWHGYLNDISPGQLYGYRVYGPYDPQHGHRFNPNKLLLDPYAKKISGRLVWSDAHFAYRTGSPREDLSFDRRDNARAHAEGRRDR